MKRKLMSLGVLVLFYSSIVVGVLLLNTRFNYINNYENNNTYVAMNN